MTTTRFAPSPTGALHLGNLRTAVFNAMLARRANGRFVLRLDDTDEARSEERFAAGIRTDLRWLGLDWDEEHRQSDRLDRYDAAAERLKAAGRLYPCWETPAELALRRKRLLAAGRPPVYDRAALKLTEAEKAALAAERPPHWRFRLDHEPIEWIDGVRGPQSIDAASVSDPVLIREDGRVLYTLSSVVDDAEMRITHVVRGADHVTNTATQLQIFAALGAEAPAMAHHSLMTGPGGEKLSKRLGGLAASELREEGVEPLAVVAYLARLGSSKPVEPVWSLDAAAAGFDLADFGLAPTRVSPDELRQLSERMIREAPYEAVADRLPDGVGRDFWEAVRPNLDRLEDVATWLDVAEAAPPKVEEADRDFVEQAMALLPPHPWTTATWSEWTAAVKAETGRKGRALFLPLRRALTGRDSGPDMGAFMPFLKR
ncbi:MAG: glutamate--tRNA ligase [Pseudomonadota bacterium]